VGVYVPIGFVFLVVVVEDGVEREVFEHVGVIACVVGVAVAEHGFPFVASWGGGI